MTSRNITEQQLKHILDNKDLKTVQFISPSENSDECAMVIGTTMFSSLYIIPQSMVTKAINLTYNKDVLVFDFKDSELTDAWKQSYLDGGITEDRWDRRTIFHPYDEMNEQFCIDSLLYEEITGLDRIGKPILYELPSWKEGIVEWYREKILYNPFCEELGFDWGLTKN